MTYLIQQGDCLLKKCGTKGIFINEHPEIPKDAKPLPTNLVLKGMTNNHALYGGEFEILEHSGTTFVRVKKESVLDHVKDLQSMERAEHHAQPVLEGEYFMDQVNEMDHIKDESRKVID